MNLTELKIKLQEIGISELAYSFAGGLPNEAYCLTKTDSGWEIYYSERGNKNGLKKFVNEQDACDYFFSTLTEDSTVMENLER